MTLKIEIPENIILKGNDEIVIRLSGSQCQYTVLPSNDDAQKTEAPSIPTLSKYVKMLTQRLVHNGKHRVAETYSSTLRSFLKFRCGKDIPLDQLTHNVVEDYECYLRHKDLSLNTVSFYLKRLRAIYNKALLDYPLVNLRPFAHSFTKTTKTRKRAIPLSDIRRIASAKVKNEQEALARDLFLLSYYTRGMAFVDLAFLKKTDVRDGFLIYRRHKTGQELHIAWRPCMQRIIDRHPSLDGIHLLGILDREGERCLRWQYHRQQCRVNEWLKAFAHRIGIPYTVTMYCARHSWATIAREQNIPMCVISDGMGHNSEKTTRIYLKSLKAELIDGYNDRLNELIWKEASPY